MASPRLATLAVLASSLLVPLEASPESMLRLSRPATFDDVQALTLDESGRRIGSGHVRVSRRDDGGVSLLSESRVEGGGGNRLTAELAPAEGGAKLVPVLEESRTELQGGQPLGFLRIDHGAGRIQCASAAGETEELALPPQERVALAPMNLLFQPLVHGEVDEIGFQVAICKGGPRVVEAHARRMPSLHPGAPHDLLEIRYELDFGPLLSAVVRPFLPRFSLWFDRAGAGDWMAHRMPLYSKGPTVVVMRAGLAPDALGLDTDQ